MAGILGNHIQQKITSQQIETAAGKDVASTKKVLNTKKNEAGTNSSKIQGSSTSSANNTGVGDSKSKVANNDSPNTNNTTSVNTPQNGTVSKSSAANDKNAPKNTTSSLRESDKSSQVTSSVKNNTEEANFSIVDHEDSSKNFSSHETLAGMSVADITISVLKRQGIYIQYTSSITGIYVSDINHQQEKSKGPSSGWVYYVNGKKASVGASGYKLNSGDTVQWQFWADAINN